MLKKVTAITLFNDAVGKRIHIVYSEIDTETGKVLSDQKSMDRLITDETASNNMDSLMEFAQNYIDNLEV